MGQIIKYLTNMLPYMLVSLPVLIAWRIIAVHFMKRKNKKSNGWHEAEIVLFSLFLVGLASQTIIPKFEFAPSSIGFVGAILPTSERLNLIPFKVLSETYTAVFQDHYINYFLINMIGNIMMFMPIGFFLPVLWTKCAPFKVTLGIGFCITLLIELCQLPLARSTDIDDLWLNVVGVSFGYLIYLLFKKIAPRFLDKCKTSAIEISCQKPLKQLDKF